MDPRLARAAQITIAVVTAVSLAGPMVAELGGVLPATWLAVASRAVGFCGALVLWLSQTPQLRPLLQARPQVVSAPAAVPCPSCGTIVPTSVRIRTP